MHYLIGFYKINSILNLIKISGGIRRQASSLSNFSEYIL